MPICKQCKYMQVTGYAKRTANNLGRGAHPRGYCMCEHPKSRYMFCKMFPRSRRLAGFIGFTSMNDNKPQIKTAPRWCPLKNGEAEA